MDGGLGLRKNDDEDLPLTPHVSYCYGLEQGFCFELVIIIIIIVEIKEPVWRNRRYDYSECF